MSNKLRIKNWTVTTKQGSGNELSGTLKYANQAQHTLEVTGAAEIAMELQAFMHYISGRSQTLEILGENKLNTIDISTEGLKKFCKMVLSLDHFQVLELHDNEGNVIRFNITDHAR